MKRPDAPRLIDIIEAADRVSQFLTGSNSFDDFFNNEILQSAILFQLVVIGEASANLSQEFKGKYSYVPWIKIKDFRNFTVHEYFAIDLHRVWDAAKLDTPILKDQVIQIFNQEFPDLIRYLPPLDSNLN